MKIGIICACEDELAPFLEDLQETAVTERAMLTFHTGKIGTQDVVLLYSGVCKVNAAIATQVLLDDYHVDLVINAGVAGGMDPKLQILDTVIATEVAYHDVAEEVLTEYHPWMKTVFFQTDEKTVQVAKVATEGLKTKGKIWFGRMVTGEAFITDDGRQEILDAFAPLSVDMETGSMAHVCYVNKVPFLAIRSITDTADHSGAEHFANNVKEASWIAKQVTVAVIEALADR